jgi:integrase
MATIVERIQKDGSLSYKVVVRVRGYPTATASFDKKSSAKIWAQQTEVAMREGRYIKTPEARRKTLADMVDRYISTVVPVRHKNPTAKRKVVKHLLWWKAQLGECFITDVTPARLIECRDVLLSTPPLNSIGKPFEAKRGEEPKLRSPSTVVRYFASLSVMFTTAVNEWEWVRENPVERVRKPQEPRGRVRFLSDSERDALLAACKKSRNPYLYPIVVLTLSTGARHGEIMSIEWKNVDLARNVIVLDMTKNGERRALPLVGHAHELIAELSRNRVIVSKYVFPRSDGKKPMHIQKEWKRALAAAGIEDFRFHDLRHTAASYLAMSGATIAEIAEVLGHKTLQMVKRYAHLSEQHTTAVVARMNKRMFG